MDFVEWMTYGIQQGWCGAPVCYTHDGLPTAESEDEQFDEGSDPCLHVVRLYEDTEMKGAVESNHAPSVWRNHYSK